MSWLDYTCMAINTHTWSGAEQLAKRITLKGFVYQHSD